MIIKEFTDHTEASEDVWACTTDEELRLLLTKRLITEVVSTVLSTNEYPIIGNIEYVAENGRTYRPVLSIHLAEQK